MSTRAIICQGRRKLFDCKKNSPRVPVRERESQGKKHIYPRKGNARFTIWRWRMKCVSTMWKIHTIKHFNCVLHAVYVCFFLFLSSLRRLLSFRSAVAVCLLEKVREPSSRLPANYWHIITRRNVNKLPWIIWQCSAAYTQPSIFMSRSMDARIQPERLLQRETEN